MAPISPDDRAMKPPEGLRSLFKRWQGASLQEINESSGVIDFSRDGDRNLRLVDETRGAYAVDNLPGLLFFPSLLPEQVQLRLLDKIIHRDLSNPVHQTNLHFHHTLPYYDLARSEATGEPGSFFDLDKTIVLPPKDATSHKPLTIEQMLRRKLRWVTLGGQYDWTRKVYPDAIPPDFPCDVSHVLKGYFPTVDAQAAIINFYTPGDTLSIHRDVSEECDRALISISIGCDGIFFVADQAGSLSAAIRLRSGDAVLMSGESRFAWHGVPKVLQGTCPESLQSWPWVQGADRFKQWQGWLGSKRININVRQMKDQIF